MGALKPNYVDKPTRSILSLDSGIIDRPGWTITRISVLPPHRGKGIASRLIRECIRDANIDGITLFLEVVPDVEVGEDYEAARKRLIKWYESLGFKPRHEEEGFVWQKLPTSHPLFREALRTLPALTPRHLAELAQACVDELLRRGEGKTSTR